MKTLLELEDNDCRFAFGEENFLFCGKPKHVHIRNGSPCTSSYCHEHFLICTVEPYTRKVAA